MGTPGNPNNQGGGQEGPANQGQDEALVVAEDASVQLFDSQDLRKVQKVRLAAGTLITILGQLESKKFGVMAHVNITSDDPSVPSDAIIRMADLEKIAVLANQQNAPENP